MVTAEKLAKSHGSSRVLSGVDFDVPEGGRLAIMGPSGSGKTTLLRLVAGFEDADEGTVRIGGRVVSAPRVIEPPHRRGIGMVFQDLALWPHLRVWENVEFMLGRDVTPRRARRQGAAELLDAVGLGSAADRFPHQLSRGEQQRVALARALAGRPRVLLLDEPLSSLDAASRHGMLALILEVQRARHLTLLYVTHQTDEATALGCPCLRLGGGADRP